jgi:hypothetical protein
MAPEEDDVSQTPRDDKWMTAKGAAAYLGVARATFMKMVDRGAVTIRQFPGVQPVYLRSDVERLARESIQPARSA